jgi:hypothetical protein
MQKKNGFGGAPWFDLINSGNKLPEREVVRVNSADSVVLMIRWLENYELEICERKWSWGNLRYYSDACLEGAKKAAEFNNDGSWFLDMDLN